MELIRPSKKYEKSWLQAIEEFRRDPKTIKLWEASGDINNIDDLARDAELRSKGEKLPPGWVPYDLYWAIDKNEFVGIVSIRHELNDYLKQFGGHIGAEVVPSKRRLGYGQKILELSLQKARELGLGKVLVTSFENNIASWKIIEKNGGKLEDKIKAAGESDVTRRYWINLK